MDKKIDSSPAKGERFTPCLHCTHMVSLNAYASFQREDTGKILKPFHPECLPLYLEDHPEIPVPPGLSFEEVYSFCLFCGKPVLKKNAKSIDGGYVHVTAKCLKYFHIR